MSVYFLCFSNVIGFSGFSGFDSMSLACFRICTRAASGYIPSPVRVCFRLHGLVCFRLHGLVCVPH